MREAKVWLRRYRAGKTQSYRLDAANLETNRAGSEDFRLYSQNVPALLKKTGDAWSNFFDRRQKLKLP